MDEAEWLTSDDPKAMLHYLMGVTDATVPTGTLVSNVLRQRGANERQFRLLAFALEPRWESWHRLDARGEIAWIQTFEQALDRPESGAPGRIAALMRDIFGNPFCPVLIRGLGACPNCFHCPCACQNHWERGPGAAWLAWNNGTVRKMAEAIYQERRFADMPLLADALEDAGCDSDSEILMHLRGHDRCWLCAATKGTEKDGCSACGNVSGPPPYATGWVKVRGPHVRGCWVIDLLTGRS